MKIRKVYVYNISICPILLQVLPNNSPNENSSNSEFSFRKHMFALFSGSFYPTSCFFRKARLFCVCDKLSPWRTVNSASKYQMFPILLSAIKQDSMTIKNQVIFNCGENRARPLILESVGHGFEYVKIKRQLSSAYLTSCMKDRSRNVKRLFNLNQQNFFIQNGNFNIFIEFFF